jgi:peptidoglycan hydrolase-like protein with peptidoglycan-binding domain
VEKTMSWVRRLTVVTVTGAAMISPMAMNGHAVAATAGASAPMPLVATSTVVYKVGDEGRQVREIQARLRQIGWFDGDVTGYFGPRTKAAVEGFQAKRKIRVTGRVDERTLTLLEGMTTEPTRAEMRNRTVAPLDRRCRTGRVLCVDKTSRSLRWVVDGDVRMRFDARFGAASTPTREGAFKVYRKSRNHVSNLYGSSMPFAMFFSGGQAVHYSADFAAVGYNGASHGCVNIRNYGKLERLFGRVRLGDKVVVYRS